MEFIIRYKSKPAIVAISTANTATAMFLEFMLLVLADFDFFLLAIADPPEYINDV